VRALPSSSQPQFSLATVVFSADLSNGIPLERHEDMSTFYVLPPRAYLAKHLGDCAASLLPGLPTAHTLGTGLAEALHAAVAREPDTFLVYREELPDGVEPLQALADGFGAESGDEVIEVRLGTRQPELSANRRRLGDDQAPANR
jgi:hypothetical protein